MVVLPSQSKCTTTVMFGFWLLSRGRKIDLKCEEMHITQENNVIQCSISQAGFRLYLGLIYYFKKKKNKELGFHTLSVLS